MNPDGERLASLEAEVRHLRDRVDALIKLVQGPNGGNLRSRVHKLENDFAIAAMADEVREAVRQGRWSRRERAFAAVLVVCAVVGAAGTILTAVVLLS